MSFITADRDAQNARIRALNRKRKDAVYQFLASQKFRPAESLNERIVNETVGEYVFRMKLYRWVIGRLVLPNIVKEIDILKDQEKALDHDEIDIDRILLTKTLLISDRNRVLRYMLLINKNLEDVRGAVKYHEHKEHYKQRTKNDLAKEIKGGLFTSNEWT
ncbi:MAG: hypothetical protein ABW121_18995 [Candidatus Thiodiazotropha sp. 6PLUC7]|nr:hypothetical protein [Candidatus Thiodiazotropha lotti]